MLKLTKEILKDIRAAHALTVRRDKIGTGELQLSFEDNIRGKRVDTYKYWLCQADLRSYEAYEYNEVTNEKTVIFERDASNSPCVETVSTYWGQTTHANSILRSLKIGDEISFEFVGNSGNIYASKAGLHFDSFVMHVKRQKTEKNFERFEYVLNETVNLGNSARMIGGYATMPQIDKQDYRLENRERNDIPVCEV